MLVFCTGFMFIKAISPNMKNLTHYFKNSQEEKSIPETTNSEDVQRSIHEESVVKEGKQTVTEQNDTIMENKKHKKNKQNKKKRKRQSDPAVKNISELMSTSLSIVSPNGLSKNQKSKPVGEAQKLKSKKAKADQQCTLDDAKVLDNSAEDFENAANIHSHPAKKPKKRSSKTNASKSKTNDKSKTTEQTVEANGIQTPNTKKNAFEFMMESRNKSIGRNSPGKEQNEYDTGKETHKEKAKLAARKALLQSWAEKKGGTKRKRIEEDTDLVIQHKLDKRKKRLKNLLTVENKKTNAVEKRKKPKKICSESEDSQDSLGMLQKSPEIKKQHEKTKSEETNAQRDNKTNERQASKSVNNCDTKKNNLTAFDMLNASKGSANTVSIIKKKIPQINPESESNIIKIKMFSPKKLLKHNDDNVNSSKNKKKHKSSSRLSLKKENDENVSKEVTEKNTNDKIIEIETSEENSGCRPRRKCTVLKSYAEILNEEVAVPKHAKKESKKKTSSDNAKPVKLAPIFVPKPKVDAAVVEAKRNFLMSEMPSCLKKVIEKQQR